jgi:WD40 repeat protein
VVLTLAGLAVYASVQSAANARLALDRSQLLEDARRLAEEKSRLASDEAAARKQAIAARADAERRAEDLRLSLYTTNVGFARASLDRGDGASARRRLDECPPDLRRWEWAFLDRLTDSSEHAIALPAVDIYAPRFHADPKFTLLAHGGVGVYRVSRISDGQVVAEGRTDSPVAVAVSPDASGVAVVDGQQAGVVSVADGRWLWRKPLALPVPGGRTVSASSAFSGDGRRLVVVTRAGDVYCFDADRGDEIHRFTPRTLCTALAVDADGGRLWLADEAGRLHRYDAQGNLQATFADAGGAVSAIDVTPDGRTVVGANAAGDIVAWNDADPSRPTRRLSGDWPAVASVAVSPDGQTVAFAGRDPVCRAADLHRGGSPSTYVGHAGRVLHTQVSAAGDRLLTVGADGTARLWPVPLPTPFRRVDSTFVHSHSLVVTPGRDASIVAATNDGPRAWRLKDLKPGRTLDALPTQPYFQIAADRDGHRIFGTGGDGVYHFWDVASGRRYQSIQTGGTGSWAVCLSPDAATIVSGDRNQNVRSWDIDSGIEQPPIVKPFNGLPMSAAFNRAGNRLAIGGADGGVKVYAWPERRLLAAGQAGVRRVYHLAFSPDGQSLAVSAEGVPASLRNSETLQLRHSLSAAGEEARCAAFHPDGTRLAVGGGDGVVRLWDTATGVELISLRADMQAVGRVDFSADGRHLVTVGEDHVIRVWDTRPLVARRPATGPTAATKPATGGTAPGMPQRTATQDSP